MKYKKSGESMIAVILAIVDLIALTFTLPDSQPISKELTAKDVAANPMSYYGAKVNYTAGGQSDWRIFYADGDNIYITTDRPVDVGKRLNDYYGLNTRDLVTANLQKNNGKYVNKTYADDTKTSDGITYEMFKNSYNQVRRNNAEQKLSVNENGIVTNASNSLSRLTGTLQEDLYVWTKNSSLGYGYNYYWLASASADTLHHIEYVSCYDNNVSGIGFANDLGLRPLVCLKYNVALVENNGKYDLKIDKNIPKPNPKPQPISKELTAKDVAAKPMSYYGAKVNYTAGGQSNWRIFYADEENIYITTSDIVGTERFVSDSISEIEKLLANDEKYVNNTYADWAHKGITYEMFRDSYNAIAGTNAQKLVGTEAGGYAWSNNSVSRLNGLQADLYNGIAEYWLASKQNRFSMLYVSNDGVASLDGTEDYFYNQDVKGVRPIVCLKYNVVLVENNGKYDLKIDKNMQKQLNAKDISEKPMSYYGAKVNYTAGGQSNWRIFYADEENIYITTSDTVGTERVAYFATDTIEKLLANDEKYVNNTYADWAHKGITYGMFRDSYNAVVGANVQTLSGTEAGGYTLANNNVSHLNGLQANLYNGIGEYWLASKGDRFSTLYMSNDGVASLDGTEDYFYNQDVKGVRPIVCLKSNVQLVENNGKYDLKIDPNIPNPQPQPISKGLIAQDVAANPMSYYGAKVNYKDVNGREFDLGQGTDNIYWRIFYADGDNIYLTTSKSVSSKKWSTKDEAITDLTKKGIKYVNYNYASWSQDGITYAMFKDSYNQVIGNNGLQNLEGNETNGYTVQTNSVLPLTGTLQENLFIYSNKGYWLASPIANSKYSLLMVATYEVAIDDYYYSNEIRPIVCLKSNVQLVESGVKDSNGYMTYNLSL